MTCHLQPEKNNKTCLYFQAVTTPTCTRPTFACPYDQTSNLHPIYDTCQTYDLRPNLTKALAPKPWTNAPEKINNSTKKTLMFSTQNIKAFYNNPIYFFSFSNYFQLTLFPFFPFRSLTVYFLLSINTTLHTTISITFFPLLLNILTYLSFYSIGRVLRLRVRW